MIRYISALLMVCSSASLYAQEPTTDSTVNLDPISVSAPAGLPPYQPSASRVWDIVHTRVALSFDPIEKTAAAKEWIKMKPYFYATDTIELDAKGMKVDSVMLMGKKSAVPLRYIHSEDKLKVWFGKEYTAYDTIELYLRYTAMPYASTSGGSKAITDDRGLYFINTDGRIPYKPAHIWTQGETEANSHWMVTIDKPNTRFTTRIELTVPDSLTTLSNGAMVKQIKGKGGIRTDIWAMDKPIQAYAVMFAISKYSVIKDKWRDKEVNYYVEPRYAPYARKMFRYTPEMMEFFSRRTGVPYPWNKYSQVVVRDYVSGAMENTSASLFGEFMNQNDREIADKDYEDIVSHELFHQWFGDYVTCESWSNTTVNESFANYGEQLWRTYKHGKVAGENLAWSDLQLYLMSSRSKDPQLVRFKYDSREEMFDAISYNKGGATLHYLNYLIGDAAFDRAMKIYLTRNALQSAEAHNWRLAIEEATGQDWNWFFNDWYFHAGHPVLKVNYEYDDTARQLSVEVTQTQDDSLHTFRLPLKTTVIYGKEAKEVSWDIDRRVHTYTFPYLNEQKPVVIPDNAHVLPGEIKENKTPEEWLVQYMFSENYISKKLALEGAAKRMSDSSAQVVIDLALHDTTSLLRKYALNKIERAQSSRYRKRWTAQVQQMAETDVNKRVRAAAFDVLAAWKVKSALPAMFMAIWDSSYTVAGSALDGIAELDDDTAYVLAKKLLVTGPEGGLEQSIWKIIGKKGADNDIILYQQRIPWVFGTSKVSYALSLNNYLKNVDGEEAFTGAAQLYADIVVFEGLKTYRAVLVGFFAQAVAEQKAAMKSDDKEKAAKAEARIAIMKPMFANIVANEPDKEQKEKFEKMMKDNFETE